jgi:hypothetical protein
MGLDLAVRVGNSMLVLTRATCSQTPFRSLRTPVPRSNGVGAAACYSEPRCAVRRFVLEEDASIDFCN